MIIRCPFGQFISIHYTLGSNTRGSDHSDNRSYKVLFFAFTVKFGPIPISKFYVRKIFGVIVQHNRFHEAKWVACAANW